MGVGVVVGISYCIAGVVPDTSDRTVFGSAPSTCSCFVVNTLIASCIPPPPPPVLHPECSVCATIFWPNGRLFARTNMHCKKVDATSAGVEDWRRWRWDAGCDQSV